MHEEFDAAKHMICHRCYGTTLAHYDGKKIYPERPCNACKGKGFHDRNFPFAQWMSSTTTEFLLAPLRARNTRSLIDAYCPACHGERLDTYGRPCENCRGSGRVLADTNYQPKVDRYEQDDDGAHRPTRQEKLPKLIAIDSGAEWPPVLPKTGALPAPTVTAKRSASGRLSIITTALIFVALLAFVGMRLIGSGTGTTQTSIVPSTALTPPDLPIIGGAETAFLAKYGLPLKSDTINGTRIESLSGNISIAVYPTNHSVTGIIVVAGATNWTDDAAFAECANFFPQDTRLGDRHNVTDPHNAIDAWFRLGASTLLATTLPQVEFADPHYSVSAGTFIAEVYTNGPAAHLDNECSVKLSDVVVQPVSQNGTTPTGPTGTQVAGVPTPKPGVPPPSVILAPTPAPVVAGPTPTQVILDVPTPTVGPTQTPLPPPTNTPQPTATAAPPTSVPATATAVPPTTVPTVAPTVAPTNTPVPVITPMAITTPSV